MIHLSIDHCTCHDIPADQCPYHEDTYEVIVPPLEGEADVTPGTD